MVFSDEPAADGAGSTRRLRTFVRRGRLGEERSARTREDRSILDRIQHSVARLKQGLGPGDQSRLNGYLDNVREIERRIQTASDITARARTWART